MRRSCCPRGAGSSRPGLIVPEGSAEYAATRALARRGFVRMGSVPRSPELPYGQGGYLLTAKGRKLLVG